MKSSPLGDTECKEDSGVNYFKPKFDSLPQPILLIILRNAERTMTTVLLQMKARQLWDSMGYLDGKIRNPDIDEGGEKVLNNVKIYITEKSDPEYQAWVILFVVIGDALLVSVHLVLVVG